MVSNRDIVAHVVAQGRDPREVSLAEFAEFSESDGVVALDIDVPLDDAVAVMCRHHRTAAPRDLKGPAWWAS